VPAEILLGTASWADRPLIESGRFYPGEAKTPESRLRYYASRFPLVEADTTFYGLPTRATAEAWVARTPPGFTFDVKAYSLFTEHPSPVARFPKELQAMLPPGLAAKRNLYRKDMPPNLVDYCWSTFVDALAPLHDSGKLGVIVFQFPKWVFANNHTKDYLWQVKERLGHYRGAVEFRNETWMQPAERENTLALLGDAGFSYICVDEPQGFKSSVPPVAAATNDLAFVRFHGRNAAMWEKRTESSAARFDYYYRPEELDEWVPKIHLLSRQAERVHLIMNTNNADQGPANLASLEERLTAGGVRTLAWDPPN
jgi:uncharacterized protein YecE (DUF72 family)